MVFVTCNLRTIIDRKFLWGDFATYLTEKEAKKERNKKPTTNIPLYSEGGF